MNRKTSAIIRIICWFAVAAALTVALIAGLSGRWNFSFFNFGGSGWSYENSDKYSAGSASLPADKIKNIEVNWGNGSVTLTATEDEKLSVSETSKKKLKTDEQLHYYLNGDTLIIQYRASKKNPFLNWSNNLGKKLEIQIPKETASRLETVITDGVSSDIQIDSLTAIDIQADTVSGDIYLENIVTDSLTTDTVSGELSARSLTVKKTVSSDTVSGDTLMEGSINAVNYSSVSGALSITSAVCPQHVQADTTSGDVLITIPDNPGFSLSYDTVSGDMKSDFAAKDSGSRLIYGSGENELQVNTTSGDFIIRQSN